MSGNENDGLPKAVREADEASEAAMAAAETQGTQPAAAEVPVDPATGQTPAPAQPPAPAAAEPTPGPADTVSRQEYDLLMQRWRTFKGVHRAAQAQISTLTAENEALRKENASLKAAAAKPGHLRHLKPEEVESFREETLDVQARMARGTAEEVVDAREASLRQYIDEQIAKVTRTPQPAAAPYNVWDDVDDEVPGASRINDTDKGWAEWLEGPDSTDPTSSRREIGVAAADSGASGVPTLTRLMKEYIAERDARKTTHHANLRRQLKPETAATAPANGKTGTEARVWKESEIRKHYEDYAKGRFPGTDADHDRIEAEIELATQEGRVTYGV